MLAEIRGAELITRNTSVVRDFCDRLHIDLTRAPAGAHLFTHEQAIDHPPSPHRPKGASAMTPCALNREPRL
jgi:hypothetical protein